MRTVSKPSESRRRRSQHPTEFLLCCLIASFLLLNTGATGFQWEADDAIIFEVDSSKTPESSSNVHSREKRQLFPGIGGGIFPPGWPFAPGGPVSVSQPQVPQLPQFPQAPQFPGNPAGISQPQYPQYPGGISQQFPQFPGINIQHIMNQHPPTASPPALGGGGPCVTNNGLQGYCASFRACYPVLYSPEDGHIMNRGLAEMYRNNSGPCNGQEIPNFFMFRADAELRQSQICCGSSLPLGRPPHNQQLTMRPPWALPAWSQPTAATTTTTTTQRPTQAPPQWPNWPPTQSSTTQRYPQQTWQTSTRATTVRPPPAPTTTSSPPVASSCGVSKIVGGDQATKGEFPWLVALVRNGKQVCGGSLIDSQYILTAAHCFNGVNTYELQTLFKVYIGDYDLHTLNDGPMTVKSISKLILHRQFHEQYFYNDIALLKLDSPVQIGSNGNNDIRPICLSTGGNYEGMGATVAGWGRLSDKNPYQPGTYRKVGLQIWNQQQCAAKYGPYAPGGITSQMLCAGQSNKDSCLGDSGGPLMQQVGNRWEQIGLVSWGIGCGAYPGVYTRVADYQSWISRHRHY